MHVAQTICGTTALPSLRTLVLLDIFSHHLNSTFNMTMDRERFAAVFTLLRSKNVRLFSSDGEDIKHMFEKD